MSDLDSKLAVMQSTILCPRCGHRETEIMPADACQFFYECKHCGVVMHPKRGDCCVFCSYGDVPCPPVQAAKGCCGGAV
jgi:hypothetical protein